MSARGDERVEDCEIVTGLRVSNKQEVRSSEGDPVVDAALAEVRTSAEVAASSLQAESANLAHALASVNTLLADLMSARPTAR